MRSAHIHTVHPNAVAQLRRILTELGIPPAPIFSRVGLASFDLSTAARAPRAALLAAKGLAARKANDPCLGFRIGGATRIENFSVWGAAVQHAPSLREALRIGVSYVEVWEQGTQIDLAASTPGRLRVSYRSLTPTSPLAETIDGQQSIMFLLSAMRALLGPQARLIAGFVCAPPRHAHCAPPAAVECRYQEAAWYVDIPTDAAPIGRSSDHPELAPVLTRVLAEESNRLAQPADLVSRVRGLLLAHLAANWGIGELASVLGMSARVLQQRLRAAGTSFSSELIAVRIDVARSLLAEPGSSVKEVAQAVGFLDVASFSRFLRRHTGRPPSSHQG